MVLCFIQQPVKNTLPVEDVYEVMSGVPTEQEVSEQLAKGRSVHSPSVNMLPWFIFSFRLFSQFIDWFFDSHKKWFESL